MNCWTTAAAAALILGLGLMMTSATQGEEAKPAAKPAAKAAKAPRVVDKTKPVSDEEVKKITDAIAQVKPVVAPTKPRKLLVFSVSPGYWHTAIPYGKKVAEILAARTGAFEAAVSDDLANFEPENLKKFDAVWFNNANNEVFLPDPEEFKKMSPEDQAKATARDEALKKSLVEWLKGGKGIYATHAAVAMFREWPEFGNIIGARFTNHPWVGGSKVWFKVEEPGHPLAQAFKASPFEITDETYQVEAPYSRDLLRVLVSIDTTKTNMQAKGIKRTDGDFAITWIRPYGQGRVGYCAIGHDHPLFWNPMVIQHYLDGIQFALGDLKADATASAKIKK